MIQAAQPTPAPQARPAPLPGSLSEANLNRIAMNIDGDRVLLSGVFDIKGLRKLEKKIATLKALLDEGNDEAGGDDDDED